ncbi:laccase domain-containing protein [Candidatus Fermentibacteria bacterium]|nr:laccase domain-containing protein [Candidatus Fermentibacteria bacterium]
MPHRLAHVIVSSAGESAPYRDWFDALPITPGSGAAPEQLHTAFIAHASRAGWYSGVDGVVTRRCWALVRTADCVPMALIDQSTEVRALIHAGRAGIGAGIVETAVATLMEAGATTETLRAAVGPHIGGCCYRFPWGSPAASVVADQIPVGAVRDGDHLVVDLAREITARLRRLGVACAPLVDSRCTCCHPMKLPSHRREGTMRRHSLLSLSGPLGEEHVMNVDPELVSILACPETKEPVELAPHDLVTTLNEMIRAGAVKNRGGEPVAEPVDGGLIREDRRFLYPIREDIPIMLIDEAIELPPLGL